MSRNAWNLIKSSKRFNVSIYRSLGTVLVISMGLNVVLSFWISHLFFNRPGYTYYSTNGVTPPEMLTALDARNMSPDPLLPSSQESGDEEVKQAAGPVDNSLD